MWKREMTIGAEERASSQPRHPSLEQCGTSQPEAKLSADLNMKGGKWMLLARTAGNVFIKTIAFQTVKTTLAERMYYSEGSDFFLWAFLFVCLKGGKPHSKMI